MDSRYNQIFSFHTYLSVKVRIVNSIYLKISYFPLILPNGADLQALIYPKLILFNADCKHM